MKIGIFCHITQQKQEKNLVIFIYFELFSQPHRALQKLIFFILLVGESILLLNR